MKAKRPRLAYLFSRYPVVSHTFCDNEILALEAAGWDVVVASLYPPKNDLRHERLNASRVPVLYAPAPVVQKTLESQAKKRGFWPEKMVADHDTRFGVELQNAQRCRNILYFAKLFVRLKVDHVHVHFANNATHSALFLKALTGITFSFTPQAADFLVDLKSPALLAELCKEAAFVVAPCGYAREKILELCPGTPAQILRIYNGIDPAGYSQAQPRSGKLRMVSVGRLLEFKGFHHLIAAMRLAREAGVETVLDLMGDGPWRERLEQQTRDAGLSHAVHFHGSVRLEQMKQAFEKADVFALACTTGEDGASDMLPTVITEAMLSGLPVLSSRVAGVPEQVIHGETGFLTAPGDEQGLADALIRLARESGLTASMGRAGRERAVEVFSIQSTMRELSRAFEEMGGQVAPAQAPSWSAAAFYDLGFAAGRRRLRADYPALKKSRTLVLAASGNILQKDLEKFTVPPENLFWLPDGMVLELEWFNRWEEREELEKLRTELSTAVEGTEFFAAARRALWWMVFLRSLGGVSRLYAPGPEEALTVWITARLMKTPLLLGFEPRTKLHKRMVSEGAVLPAIRLRFLHRAALRKALGDSRMPEGSSLREADP